MSHSAAPRRPACDFEEISPRLFLIHTIAVKPFIKSEGKIVGNRFAQTGWRRDGMLARLRQAGFRVLTLEDQIDVLPAPVHGVPLGASCRCARRRTDRLATFDGATLAWVPLTVPLDASEVELPANSIVRRRRAGGADSYTRVRCHRDGRGELVPLDVTMALLEVYGHVRDSPPAPRPLTTAAGGTLLPDVPLPPAYEHLLKRFATYQRGQGWRVESQSRTLAQRLYARLGIPLR